MQPQNEQKPPPVPNSPSSEYDFIYNEQQKPKRKLSLGRFSKRPAYLILGGLSALTVLTLIFASILGGGSSNTQELTNLMARGQEIIRISNIVELQTKDSDTKGLAQTTVSSLTSDQAVLNPYLASQGKKVAPIELAIYVDKKTDTQLQSAAQINNLESFYYSYLKDRLTKYQSYINTAFKNSQPKAQTILRESNASVKTLLASPQLTTVSSP